MNVQACPEDNHLADHLLGRIQGERAEQLDAHLESCESCLERAHKLKPSDDLIRVLGLGVLDLNAEEQRQNEIAEKAYTLNLMSATTTGHSLPSKIGNEGSESPIDFSFLTPAQEDDELGRLGRYRVLEVLGAGGMGVVFRAEDTLLKREVALKAMKPEIAANASARRRFIREARATAAIEHDNIVTIHEVNEEGEAPYLAMRFLPGESLRDRLDMAGALPIDDVLKIGREVASGLAAAHQQGLIHRDIKPDNIWLERRASSLNSNDSQSVSAGSASPQTERVKIVDFGLVHADDDIELTKSGAVMGTPRYMSPEQAQGQPIDHRSDLFSLGAVLYHLTTGVGPFDRNNLTATLLAVSHDTPASIESLRADAPAQLVALIRQLLEKEPEKRFQSADGVVREIVAIEQQRVDQQAIDPAAFMQSKPARRDQNSGRNNWLWGAIGGIAMAALLAALGIVFLIPTPEGTLRVEVDDDDLQVLVDDKLITLTDKKWSGKKSANRHQLAIKLGKQTLNIGSPTTIRFDGELREHLLQVKVGGATLSNDRFEVVRGKETVLKISLETKPAKPSKVTVVKLPEQLSDLAKGVWQPPVTKSEDLAKTLNHGGVWKDDTLEVTTPEGRVDGRVVFEYVRGRRIIVRADVERVRGHSAGLAFEGENRSFNAHGSKNRNIFMLSERENGKVGQIDFEPTDPSGTFGVHDMALAMIDGHAGLYLGGKLVAQRDGFKTWKWTPYVTNFNWEGKEPAYARFRNIRVMVLADDPAETIAAPMKEDS